MRSDSALFEFTITVRVPAPGFLSAALDRVRRTLDVWRTRLHQRRALERLDPRLLADIGITRDIQRDEAAKPFWRA